KGKPLEKFYPVFEMHDTIAFTPGQVTKGDTHVRDGLDLKRMMVTVVVAMLPAVGMALYNVGYQSHLAMQQGAVALDNWQEAAYAALGLGYDPANLLANVVHGALYFVPLIATCFLAGGAVEVGTAIIRKHEVNEGFLVSGFLIPLIVPPTLPLWQMFLGTVFGILIGKEIFGGTGFNILNPALVARAFLFFAYPAEISGDKVWIAADFAKVDGVTGATWLAKASEAGMDATAGLGQLDWWDAFLGFVPGSMGETSAAAALIGAVILVATQIGSWRTMLGVTLGTIAMASLLNSIGSETNPFFNVPFWYHMVLGGWAFGTVFMATEPVTSPFTETGKLIYGFFIGVLVVLVRVINPAYPEGMMLAILFMNMFAPFIDHWFVQANIKRRLARHAV
ncbi:MAG: Na(+)-translocating NADH-quinone reductase subunit, partial [Pseudomonadota bacterium]